ncbi:hypothetical protein SAMN05421504_1021148 [Amycolatopsis xylanica]|uniref:Uncharacterized protein n=1 Tax=Amycolatopsis xylanica TaxID=589385 RepID=A0A1H3B254_9PSEU|nr:hypothetical protein SAMN05421504_1021148 [Amycolatopsis xylanica]
MEVTLCKKPDTDMLAVTGASKFVTKLPEVDHGAQGQEGRG